MSPLASFLVRRFISVSPICHSDSAAVLDVRPWPIAKLIKPSAGAKAKLTSNKDAVDQNEAGPRVQEGDRVVWPSDAGPEFGVVRWIGHLAEDDDQREGGLLAGVEFVSAATRGILVP